MKNKLPRETAEVGKRYEDFNITLTTDIHNNIHTEFCVG
jgi:hypothetical protein